MPNRSHVLMLLLCLTSAVLSAQVMVFYTHTDFMNRSRTKRILVNSVARTAAEGTMTTLIKKSSKHLEETLQLNYTKNKFDSNTGYLIKLAAGVLKDAGSVAMTGTGGKKLPYLNKNKRKYLESARMDNSTNMMVNIYLASIKAYKNKNVNRQKFYRLRKEYGKVAQEDTKKALNMLGLPAVGMLVQKDPKMMRMIQKLKKSTKYL